MASTRDEALDNIDRILAENDAVIGAALHFQTAGEHALSGVVSVGNAAAATVAEGTELDTVVINGDGIGSAEERALQAGRAARDSFLPLPSSVQVLARRALSDIADE